MFQQLWKKTQKTKTENSRFTDLSFPNTDRQKDWTSITILKRKSNGIKNNGIKEGGREPYWFPAKVWKRKSFICNYSLLCTGNNITGKCEKYVVRIWKKCEMDGNLKWTGRKRENIAGTIILKKMGESIRLWIYKYSEQRKTLTARKQNAISKNGELNISL